MKAHPGAAFVFPASPLLTRNSDVHFPFRQESNFFYLSGFEEPESCLVLIPSKSKPGDSKMILFVQPRNPLKEMWEGERYGVEGAQAIFGADQAYPIQELDQKLPELLLDSEKVFYRVGFSEETDRRILAVLESQRRSLGRSGKSLLPILDPNEAVGEMRLFKTSEEVQMMRKGCQISAAAHRAAMKEVRPGMNEGEVEALVDYIFRKEGCQRVGYGSIVAGGKNATCLHYRSNNESLKDGDLLLIDAGGEYQYYSADITRTFPVGKAFTSSQAKLYDLVLRAQKEGIEMSRPGAKLPDIHKHICEVLIDGLLSLSLLSGKPADLLKNGDYRRFYPHSTSHWLGMDVHDVGLYTQEGEPRALQAGMVFTIEPGIYTQPTDLEIPTSYQKIGIRIEDDILITSAGYENLTKDAPKERSEIESLRA